MNPSRVMNNFMLAWQKKNYWILLLVKTQVHNNIMIYFWMIGCLYMHLKLFDSVKMKRKKKYNNIKIWGYVKNYYLTFVEQYMFLVMIMSLHIYIFLYEHI